MIEISFNLLIQKFNQRLSSFEEGIKLEEKLPLDLISSSALAGTSSKGGQSSIYHSFFTTQPPPTKIDGFNSQMTKSHFP